MRNEFIVNVYNWGNLGKPASAKHRCLARSIDIFICLIQMILTQSFEHFLPEGIIKDTNFIVRFFLFYMVYEILSLILFKKTIGKALLGIEVSTEDYRNISFATSIKRFFLLLIFGHGLFIIPATLFLSYHTYTKISSQVPLQWDLDTRVSYFKKKSSTIPILVFLCLIFVSSLLPKGMDYILNDFVSTSTSMSMERDVKNYYNNNNYTSVISYLDHHMLPQNETPFLHNIKGLSYMALEETELAIESFSKSLSLSRKDEDKDIALCNLSWAYYRLEDFASSLDYSKKSLEVLPNDIIEYTNHGNALLEFDDYEGALTAYETALSFDEMNIDSLSNLAYFYFYYKKDYERTIYYLELNPEVYEDPFYKSMLGISYYYFDQRSDGLMLLEEAYKINPSHFDVIYNYALYYIDSEDYTSAYNILLDNYPSFQENSYYLSKLSDLCLSMDKYTEALKYNGEAITLTPDLADLYIDKAYIYYKSDNQAGINQTLTSMLKSHPTDALFYNAAGDIRYQTRDYADAIHLYSKAISLDPQCDNAYSGIFYSHFYNKRYTKCIETYKEAFDHTSDYDIYWTLGNIYTELFQYEKALTYFTLASAEITDNENLYLDIALSHFYLHSPASANYFVEKALKINKDNANVIEFKAYLDQQDLHIIEQIDHAVSDDYMYYQTNDDYMAERDYLLTLPSRDITTSNIKNMISKIIHSDDRFSFIIDEKYYDYYREMMISQSVFHHTIDEDIEYIRIEQFTPVTANEFVDIIDTFIDTENKNLIIDLRDNGGGDTDSGCDILDFLLAEHTVCTTTDRNQKTYNYYSDENMLPFKQIYIFVNENSASCSEIVTLGLKTYLDHVTIIGQTTYGKGVGQIVSDYYDQKMYLALVNHTWNIDGQNIDGIGISPDIVVKSDDINDYLNYIQ